MLTFKNIDDKEMQNIIDNKEVSDNISKIQAKVRVLINSYLKSNVKYLDYKKHINKNCNKNSENKIALHIENNIVYNIIFTLINKIQGEYNEKF